MKIKGLEIKNFHEFKYGHGDSRTFSAELWMDGKQVAIVSNDGYGGSNSENFVDRKFDHEYQKRCKEWLDEKPEERVSTDMLVEELIIALEHEKIKKKNIKKGYPISVLCKKGKEKMGKFIFFNEQFIIGLKDMAHLPEYIEKNKIEEYQVI